MTKPGPIIWKPRTRFYPFLSLFHFAQFQPLDIYKIAEEFYNSRNPLMASQSVENIYAVPKSQELKMRKEEEKEEEEHIYEDIDSLR